MKVIALLLNALDKRVVKPVPYEPPTLEEACKNPCLDDEGTHDYLAFGKPSDYSYWVSRVAKCDCCGKYHRVNLSSISYFYTYDGYDSFDDTECFRCFFVGKIRSIKRKIKHFTKVWFEFYKELIDTRKSYIKSRKQLIAFYKKNWREF